MSQAGEIDVVGTHPEIPTEFIADVGTAVPIANQLELLGEVVANGVVPFQSVASGNTVTYQVQLSNEIADTDATKVGLSAFNSASFDVDGNGFVNLLGGGVAATNIDVDAHTAPGTDPVVPNGSGNITLTGAQVASGVVGANVIRSDSTVANTVTIEIQRSTAVAATDSTKNGVSHFDSEAFSVDSNGFVSAATALKVPVGTMAYFSTANNTTYPNPSWLKCDGSLVNQADYPELYTKVGLINEVGTNLNAVTNATFTQTPQAIVFGNSIFVAGGPSGSLYTSTDGATWTARTSGTASNIRALAYGAGIFVLGTNGGGVSTSTDAITWTARTSGTTSTINTLKFLNNLFMYGAAAGGLSTSTDAITWTARTSGVATSIVTFAYVNSLYLYGGSTGALATSTDAITWTVRTFGVTMTPSSIYYENSLYVAAGSNGFRTSTDAITWTSYIQPPSNNVLNSSFPYGTILKINGVYVGSSNTGLGTSTDGFYYAPQYTNITGGSTPFILAYDGVNTLVGILTTAINFTGSIYTYNTATSFKLPSQNYYNPTLKDNTFNNLYIKAL